MSCPVPDKVKQSHYIEVAQGGVPVEQYTIDCEYLSLIFLQTNSQLVRMKNKDDVTLFCTLTS